MNSSEDTTATTNRNFSKVCPRCGAELPTEIAIVCPGCDAILRPDPEVEELQKEGFKSRNLVLMAIGAIIIFALTFRFTFQSPLISLGFAIVYVLAFKFSERRTNQPVGLALLSVLVWAGFCSVIFGILFVGCIVDLSRGH